MKQMQFFQTKVAKSAESLKGIASLITQSVEIEAMTKTDEEDLRYNLNRIGKGLNSDESANLGNGWNDDVHHDVSLTSYDSEHGGIYGTETSSSPIDIVGWDKTKEYLNQLLDTYKTASRGLYHTVRGSMHTHNTVSYTIDENYRLVNAVDVNVMSVYHNVARFFLKFMPVMKWLGMTDKKGARGVRGSSYGDKFDNDKLFYWWNDYRNSEDGDIYLCNMDRSSCLRIFGDGDRIHFENRLCDCTFSVTHINMWLAINRAITLLSIDFARNGYMFNIADSDIRLSKQLMYQHSGGYRNVDKSAIESLYKQFVSYLAKYLKITNNLEAIEVMDKLIKKPIPEYLTENNIEMNYWNLELIERSFNTRNRASDTALRDKYLHAIKTMILPYAESLNDFNESMANYLQVDEKKVKSLYQMFKKENVDIEFLGGRLVYLGD